MGRLRRSSTRRACRLDEEDDAELGPWDGWVGGWVWDVSSLFLRPFVYSKCSGS